MIPNDRRKQKKQALQCRACGDNDYFQRSLAKPDYDGLQTLKSWIPEITSEYCGAQAILDTPPEIEEN